MDELTPTEIAARELIAAAESMGAQTLRRALAPETRAALERLLSAEEGVDSV